MLIKYLRQRIRVAGFMGLLILALTLAACDGDDETVVSEETNPAGGDAAATTETEAAPEVETTQEVEATQPSEVTEETEEAEAEVAQAQPVSAASCEPVVIPDNDRIAAPSEKDWAKGPATASVTVIEYGDFQ